MQIWDNTRTVWVIQCVFYEFTYLKSNISGNFQQIFIPKSAIESQRVALSDGAHRICKLVRMSWLFEYPYHSTFLKFKRK